LIAAIALPLGACSSTDVPELQTQADRGNAWAQVNLGSRYARHDEGVPHNDAEAAAWTRLAADQGNPTGELNMGVLTAQGRGVPQDYAASVEWYRRAAQRGLPAAQLNLGVAYDLGLGVPADAFEAEKLWKQAKLQQMPGAGHNLIQVSERLWRAPPCVNDQIPLAWRCPAGKTGYRPIAELPPSPRGGGRPVQW
jgi:TPR repeat protein